MKRWLLILSLLAHLDLGAATPALFTSSDKELEEAYTWASGQARAYSHAATEDAVGPWYEAALPLREAFCMRDVAHQAVAGEILGLRSHNLNMMTHFVSQISEAKDWCTYWEINRHNEPVAVDYRNDQAFWYNLNANFDLIFACLKLYNWTGDTRYLCDPRFTHFYQKSLHEYVQRWSLQPDSLRQRRSQMNAPADFDPTENLHTCRGLASYIENFRSLTMSADLIAALIGGHEAYAQMARINGHRDQAAHYTAMAQAYRKVLDEQWWSDEAQEYFSFWSSDKQFHRGEGATYLLWFDAIAQPERIRAVVDKMDRYTWNVENKSHFPALFYRLGDDQRAYRTLVELPHLPRADYPEVSFGVVEGVIGGVMGIQPDAHARQVSTLCRLHGADQWARADEVPLWEGHISVDHASPRTTTLVNHTGQPLTWRATFRGKHRFVRANGKQWITSTYTDSVGSVFSFADIVVNHNQICQATSEETTT